MNDVGLQPAKALLNNQVRRYKVRPMMMPDSQGRGRMLEMRRNVLSQVEGFDELIPEEPFKQRSYKRATLPKTRRFLDGTVIIQDKKQAMMEAQAEREGHVFWTDGSRKEDEWVGCAVVWREWERWKKRRTHLGQQKEAFDAEMYAMSEVVKIADEMSSEREVKMVTISMDSQATLKLLQLDEPGLGQVLALQKMNWEGILTGKYSQVEYWWVPAHKGIEANKKVDQQATNAAYKHWGSSTEMQYSLPFLYYVSFAHIN